MSSRGEDELKSSELVVVAVFGMPELAHIAKNKLDDAGVASALNGECSAWQPDLGGSFGGVRLMTRACDAERARNILGLRQPPRGMSPNARRRLEKRLLGIALIGFGMGALWPLIVDSSGNLANVLGCGFFGMVLAVYVVGVLTGAGRSLRRSRIDGNGSRSE